MAVRFLEISVRGLACYLVYMGRKNATHLSILLDLDSRSKTESCQVTISVQMVSSKANGDPIEKSITKTIQWPFNISIRNMISWNMDLSNRKMNLSKIIPFHSITLKIEIKTDEQCSEYQSKQRDQLKRRRLEFWNFRFAWTRYMIKREEMSITPCGHSFWQNLYYQSSSKSSGFTFHIGRAKKQFNWTGYDQCIYLRKFWLLHVYRSMGLRYFEYWFDIAG